MRDEDQRQDEEAEARSADEDTGGVGLDADRQEDQPAVEAELEELRAELAEVRDRHLRLAAEFDNYRKRNERDRHVLVTRHKVDLIASLLEIVDDLERVGQSGEEVTPAAVLEGVQLVQKKFQSALGAAGVEPIEAEGELFDPAVMEAMMVVPTDDPSMDDRVADVFQRGYRFGDVLVRPARVRVLKHEGAAEGSE
jgi:molecular chaperone GrpE